VNFEHSLVGALKGIRSVNLAGLQIISPRDVLGVQELSCNIPRSTRNGVEVVMLKFVGRIGPATRAD
jgi:hypothetical protein